MAAVDRYDWRLISTQSFQNDSDYCYPLFTELRELVLVVTVANARTHPCWVVGWMDRIEQDEQVFVECVDNKDTDRLCRRVLDQDLGHDIWTIATIDQHDGFVMQLFDDYPRCEIHSFCIHNSNQQQYSSQKVWLRSDHRIAWAFVRYSCQCQNSCHRSLLHSIDRIR